MEQHKEVPMLPQITSLIKSYMCLYRTPSPSRDELEMNIKA
jgi:hypothetical protein